MARTVKKKIDSFYKPHPAQLTFHQDPHRFRVLSCGRRWGKSTSSIVEVWKVMNESMSKNPRAWVIAPTFLMVEENWKIAETLLSSMGFIKDKQIAKMRLQIHCNDGRVGDLEFKSADASDETLRGAGLDCALFDEASRIKEDTWLKGVRPALADRRGRGIFISTPKGRNWFYRLYVQGQNAAQGNPWKSWKFPSNENPHFPPEEWTDLEKVTPKQTWDEEYLAEFNADSSSAFGDVDSIPTCAMHRRNDDDIFSIGVDLARTVDFTVLIVMNQFGQVIDFHRSRNLDWPFQEKIIQSYADKYRPSNVYIDSSGVGDPIEQNLKRKGVSAIGIKTGSTTQKDDLIENLKIVIEQKWISLPSAQQNDTVRWLWEELRSYGAERLEISGRMRYAAPQGLHDDGVIALALAAWGFKGRLGKAVAPKEAKKDYATFKDYMDICDERRTPRKYGRVTSIPTLNIRRRVL